MAQLGFRTVNEMVGHVEALDTSRAAEHWKACAGPHAGVARAGVGVHEPGPALQFATGTTAWTRRWTSS